MFKDPEIFETHELAVLTFLASESGSSGGATNVNRDLLNTSEDFAFHCSYSIQKSPIFLKVMQLHGLVKVVPMT